MPSEIPDTSSDALLRTIREMPVAYGTWQTLKRRFKETDSDPSSDPALLGALLGRIDVAPLVEKTREIPTADTGQRSVTDMALDNEGRLYVLGSQRSYYGADRIKALTFRSENLLKPQQTPFAELSGGTEIALCGEYAGWLMAENGREVTLQTQRLPPGSSALTMPESGDSGNLVASRGYFLGTVPENPAPRGNSTTTGGLQIFRLGPDGAPQNAGVLSLPGVSGVAVHPERRLACLITSPSRFQASLSGGIQLPRQAGIRLVDWEDPNQPRLLGSVDLGQVAAVSLSGRYAYVLRTGRGEGLQVVDISDPARPVKRGSCALDFYGQVSATLSGGYVFIVAGAEFIVVDGRDPGKPRVAFRQTGTYTKKIVVDASAKRAYFSPWQHYNAGLQIWNIEHPENPGRIGTPPRPRTMGYMKRRARRDLRTLSEQNAERFVQVATHALLAESGVPEIDPRVHWVGIDLLFAGGSRYYQTKHGRGAYRLRPDAPPVPRLRLRTREERSPEHWDRYPEQAARLLAAPGLPWQTHEMAFKVLRAARIIPSDNLPEATLVGMLTGRSTLLQAFAARQIAAKATLGAFGFAAETIAEAYLWSGSARRRQLANAVSVFSQGAEAERKRFAQRLFARVRNLSADRSLSRRQIGALALLATDFQNTIAIRDLIPAAPAMLASRSASLISWVERAARKSGPDFALDWLLSLANVAPGLRESTVTALADGMTDEAFPSARADILARSETDFIREAFWQLLAASATPPETLRALWLGILESQVETPEALTAMASPYALTTLATAGIGADELGSYLRDRPFLVGLLSSQALVRIVETVPASVALRLATVASESQWAVLRDAWLRRLREGLGLDDLWSSAEAAIRDDATGILVARLLNDTEFADTLLGVDDTEAVLQIRDDAFGPLLGRYIRRHEDRFGRGSALLLTAATHDLPDVRDWALARVSQVGMEMPFALRLLESDIPPCMAAGRVFFEEVSPGASQEYVYALALCDSPRPTVRAWGRTYVQTRLETLPRVDLLRALFENPDPQMQAFVADLLRQSEGIETESVGQFDGEALRAPNRARKAKEIIKSRQAQTPSLDTSTLLALARGRTPRDAEWALAELAKRALAGEVVEGIVVSGLERN